MISMAPPTPRQGTISSKLSLDLSNLGSYNETSTPTSPYSGLPSPTVSGSWNTNKSNAELTALLKDAYNVIKEKERDLTLAAEIGKSLLENNIALKSKYEGLAQQLQQRSKSGAMNSKPAAPRISPPNGSLGGGLETFPEEEESDYDDDDSDDESITGYNSGIEMPSSTRNRAGMSLKDMDQIRELETMNIELQSKLETVVSESQEIERINKAKVRRLEAELSQIQEAYSQATEKIETLDQDNQRLYKKQSTDFWNLKYNRKANDNDDIIERLLNKVHELEESNHAIERAKIEVEKRLQKTVKDLDIIREQCEELDKKTKDYGELQQQFESQSGLISYLNMSLEEQRNLNLMRSGRNSRAGSFSEKALSRRLSDPDALILPSRNTPATLAAQNKAARKTLLNELEDEWYRDLSFFQRDLRRRNSGTPQFSPVMSESDLSDYYGRSMSMSETEDDVRSMIDHMSEDEFIFLDEFKEDDEMAMRRREWFFRRWARCVYNFLRRIWRWCRFLVLLCAAVIMAVYRGPDDVLPNEM